MSLMDEELNRRLEELKQQQLFRKLRRVQTPQGRTVSVSGRELLNFSSNDYLGLANHQALKEAALEATDSFGAGSGASRLICGSLEIHHELEEALAEFKGTEAALLLSTGYAAAIGVITSLVGKDDFLVLDKLVHASIVDAARLSGATLRIFKHNDTADLEKILGWCRNQQGPGARQILIVTESVFSMDGDLAPLRELVALKEKHAAWLMVDEAHATGLFGEGRSGRIEEESLTGKVEIQMATLGKALGSSGGFISGSRPLVDYLVNRARSFIFSTAPSPAASGAALAGLKIVQSDEGAGRLSALRSRLEEARSRINLPSPATSGSPILPMMIGEEGRALEIASQLLEKGFLIPAIRYPTVARGKARLRITCSASHTQQDVEALGKTLQEIV